MAMEAQELSQGEEIAQEDQNTATAKEELRWTTRGPAPLQVEFRRMALETASAEERLRMMTRNQAMKKPTLRRAPKGLDLPKVEDLRTALG